MNLKKIVLAVGMFGFISCFTACNDDSENFDDNKFSPIELNQQSRAALENLNQFNYNYLKAAIECSDNMQDNDNKNVIVSPISASILLSMIANATDESVSKEIIQRMGVSDLNSLNTLSNTLLKKLPTADKKSTCRFSNALWYDNALTISQDFNSVLTDDFMANISKADFSNQNKTLNDINSWAAKASGGVIDKFIENLNPNTFALIANSTYFNGTWAESLFDKNKTKEDIFHGLSHESTVAMMNGSMLVGSYASSDECQYVSLPFGNMAFQLEIILPHDNKNLSDIQAGDNNPFEELSKIAQSIQVNITMPKFKIEGNLSMDDILRQYGFSSLLREITLKGFTSNPEGIIDFRQKTSLSIDEKGAEVAVVSSGEFVNSFSPVKKVEINLNKPFYFSLIERSTGACILAGRIADL
ncbi:MAG: hypothetical protein K2J82_02145 [Muribaculaceae bacterium]|nr:hypothetical protein [Muribaculaceae bacterium]MDE6753393.1 hypothetical protein [Muribaculaceae bacterium]